MAKRKQETFTFVLDQESKAALEKLQDAHFVLGALLREFLVKRAREVRR